MRISKPSYYDTFRCVAGTCPDSCCKEWSVSVDEASARRYRELPGALGDRLREVLRDEDGQTIMTIVEGRCPMWNADGLCRIQLELGEAGLCKVCQAFPRLTHDYGDFQELGLELSCPEAARLILNDVSDTLLSETTPGEGEAEYDEEAMAVLKATRETMLAILNREDLPVGQTLALALLYGCQAQGELDWGECQDFVPEAALETARELAKPGEIQPVLDFFAELELLTPQWEEMLRTPAPAPWERRHLAIARYLTQRYWLQAVSDYDLYSRVKFIIIACLLVKTMGGDLLRTAQLFSKEIENDADNVDALLEGAYSHPAFRDEVLLGLLLEEP